MANWHHVANHYARQYGIPPALFRSLISHESGWNPNTVSPAGALGFGQLMPGTAQGLGVNPHNPRQNLKGAAKYLSGQYQTFGNWKLALAAYNAGPGAVESGDWKNYDETTAYVRNVLGDAGGRLHSGNASQGLTGPSGGIDATSMALEQLGALAAGQATSPLEQLAALVQSVPQGGGAGRRGSSSVGGPLNVGKWTNIASGADRAGVETSKGVLRAVAGVAHIFGHPLTITTGTNHSQYTVDGNVSAHWSGNAADIAASGNKLKRMGFAALVFAGVSRKQARKMASQGGLFNVGGYQIIFRTNEGGNHWNHLHIGLSS